MAQKRIDKLEGAGIRCELTGYNGGYIRLLGYTPEMRDSLERERQEYAAAYQAWYSKPVSYTHLRGSGNRPQGRGLHFRI